MPSELEVTGVDLSDGSGTDDEYVHRRLPRWGTYPEPASSRLRWSAMNATLLLVACTGAPETGTLDSGDSGPTERGWHAVLTADGQISADHPPLVEVDETLTRVWEQDFGELEGRGAEGLDRDASGRTVYTRVTGANTGGWVDVLGPDGALAWTWEGEGAGGLSFPHGVAWTPAGDLVVADTSARRLLSVDLNGQVLWEEPLPTTAPNGLAIWTDTDGHSHLLVTGRHALAVGGSEDEELLNRYLLGDRDAPPSLTWSRVLPADADDQVQSPHGPAFLQDGDALYCARGQHQVVRVNASGEETWRSPLDRDLLDKPRTWRSSRACSSSRTHRRANSCASRIPSRPSRTPGGQPSMASSGSRSFSVGLTGACPATDQRAGPWRLVRDGVSPAEARVHCRPGRRHTRGRRPPRSVRPPSPPGRRRGRPEGESR